jgi:uncharacterized protein (TIGR03790 family)
MKRAKSPPHRTVFVAIWCLWMIFTSQARAQYLEPSQVLVIYNKADSDSKNLAEFYQALRKIPNDQILGLSLPITSEISRKEYETTILNPLRAHFTKKDWWKRTKGINGVIQPTKNRIRAIVLMRGVPLRIKANPTSATDDTSSTQAMVTTDQASVDSELELFGIELPHYKNSIPSAFFNSLNPLSKSKLPHLVLVNRIDAPTITICKNMIIDAVRTEGHGLWGRAYVDIANKFPQGDAWLESIVSQNLKNGISTVTDRFNETFPNHYPMTDASIYYGWYERNVNGPFLNPAFKFRPGAIAFHIHSYSAEQLTDPNKNWSAPVEPLQQLETFTNHFFKTPITSKFYTTDSLKDGLLPRLRLRLCQFIHGKALHSGIHFTVPFSTFQEPENSSRRIATFESFVPLFVSGQVMTPYESKNSPMRFKNFQLAELPKV